MKSLENQLGSLRPRRPSVWLRWRIFGTRAMGVPRAAKLAGWATPLTASAVLAFLILESAGSMPSSTSRGASVLAMMSNQEYAVFETSRQSVQNNLPLFTFDWTNHGVSNSNMRSFLEHN